MEKRRNDGGKHCDNAFERIACQRRLATTGFQPCLATCRLENSVASVGCSSRRLDDRLQECDVRLVPVAPATLRTRNAGTRLGVDHRMHVRTHPRIQLDMSLYQLQLRRVHPPVAGLGPGSGLRLGLGKRSSVVACSIG